MCAVLAQPPHLEKVIGEYSASRKNKLPCSLYLEILQQTNKRCESAIQVHFFTRMYTVPES